MTSLNADYMENVVLIFPSNFLSSVYFSLSLHIKYSNWIVQPTILKLQINHRQRDYFHICHLQDNGLIFLSLRQEKPKAGPYTQLLQKRENLVMMTG